MCKKMLQKIFSVKNEKEHKVIRFLGIKFKAKSKFTILKESVKSLENEVQKIRNNE